MRILLATDGSVAAAAARDLVAALPLPGGSAIEVVHAIQLPLVAMANLGPAIGPDEATDLTPMLEEDGQRILAQTVERVSGPGRYVRSLLQVGRPAVVIADLAGDRHFDLVVTGHRGRSGLEQVLLGSVAAEVVDRSPAPVLVARSERWRELLLAVDGTHVSRAAADLLVRSPAFHDCRVRVLAVADPRYPWWAGMDEAGQAAVGAWDAALAASRTSLARVARETAERLVEAGIDARALTGEGRPADVILEQAEATPTDIIVLGSRGQTGLRRMLVGSVGRDVLHHARCSVLIGRQQARAAA
jgi:nucleotide-binding universal stress UspA family protein